MQNYTIHNLKKFNTSSFCLKIKKNKKIFKKNKEN